MTVSIFNMADTWNNAGTVFNAILMNISNGAGGAPVSGFGSSAINIQNNGTTVFTVGQDGIVGFGAGAPPPLALDATLVNTLIISASATNIIQFSNSLGVSVTGKNFGFGVGSTTATSVAPDAFWSRRGAANVQQGGPDIAAPIAQIYSFSGVSTGVPDTAGRDATFNCSRGTGGLAGGNFVFQTSPAGNAGSVQNPLTLALTITSPPQNMKPSLVIGSAALATTATDGFLYVTTCAGTPTGVPTTFTGRAPLVYDTTAHEFWIYDAGWKKPQTPAGAAIVTWQ